jgi:hypothetical protein
MAKKYNYYHVTTGFLPQIVKLAFSDEAFQAILEDHDLDVDVHAFKAGEAETHFISGRGVTLVIMVFDLSLYEDREANLIGTIAHEVSHAVDRMSEFIGGDPIADEPRAYLTESLVGQVYTAVLEERKTLARKANRKLPRSQNKETEWFVPEMDLDDNGSSGSNSDTPKHAPVRRTKDKIRRDQSEAETSIQPIGTARVSSRNNKK